MNIYSLFSNLKIKYNEKQFLLFKNSISNIVFQFAPDFKKKKNKKRYHRNDLGKIIKHLPKTETRNTRAIEHFCDQI